MIVWNPAHVAVSHPRLRRRRHDLHLYGARAFAGTPHRRLHPNAPYASTSCQTEGGLPLTISGKLRPGKFSLAGNISSQFITGLMLALPLLPASSTIVLTSPLESKGYVDLTIEVLRRFGIEIQETTAGWYIPGSQAYTPRDYTVEGDWSQAAFFMSAAALGSPLTLEGLDCDSVQGDKEALRVFQKFGMRAEWKGGKLLCSPGESTGERTIDASQIPDLVPAIAVTAALTPGLTRIVNAGRLRIKESDRLASVSDGLRRLGITVEETQDSLTIHGELLSPPVKSTAVTTTGL